MSTFDYGSTGIDAELKRLAESEEVTYWDEVQKRPQKLSQSEATMLKDLMNHQVLIKALRNVIEVSRADALKFFGLNFLSNPTATEDALRLQGTNRGVIRTIECLLDQAHSYDGLEE